MSTDPAVPTAIFPGSYIISALLILLVGIVTWMLFTSTARVTNDHGVLEPPYIRSWIPLLGHLIGMVRNGASYFELVNKDTQYPIFTLPMLTSRNYVVCDAHLAGLVQRNGKTLSFYMLIVEVTRRLIALDKDATKITFHDMHGERGPGGLMARTHEMMNRHLAPGPLLDAITATQVGMMGRMLNREVARQGIVVNLYSWSRRIFSMCNMEAIYGPKNIFATNGDLESAFWQFEDGMLGLVIDILPSITARKAFKARQKVLDGLVEYVRAKRYEEASPVIQERIRTNLEFGLSERMAGHSELILMFGIMGNAVPSNFWLISNIFSRPGLLNSIREEATFALETGASGLVGSDGIFKISAKKINMRSCPLLYSCYRETLREISLLTSARLVLEDTIVADQYLLRKSSVVQIAGGVLGRDSAVWGPDSKLFRPDRFLESVGVDNSDKQSPITAVPIPSGVPSAAFRAFGGGTILCPGRNFAQTELMVFAASLALMFDITETSGEPLILPAKDETRIPLSVMKPVLEPTVRIARRRGWEAMDVEIIP